MVELKDKTKLIFHKGTHTIGGTLIEISYNKDRIFFDMGAVFNREVVVRSLDDLLDNDLTTYVDGVFDPKASKKYPIKDDDFYENQAFFISHAHLDHSSMLNYTNPKIKLYTTKDSKKVIEALNVDNKFIFPFSENQRKFYKYENFTREIIGMDYDDKVEVGSISVRLIRVDHDSYGACGFIINTPDKKISYTGDIRLNGFRKNDSLNFIDQAKFSNLLISEAVSYSFSEYGEDDGDEIGEKALNLKIRKTIFENKNKAILINFYKANFERIEKIIEEVKERKLVLSAYMAYVVKKVLGKDVLYYNLKGNSYNLDKKFELSLKDMAKDYKDYLIYFDKDSLELVNLFKNSLYIHSDGEPLGEYDPLYKPFMEKLEENNIKVKFIETSGHATTRDLTYILEKINPKIVTIIHSFRPEVVYYKSKKLLAPNDGEELFDF